MKRANRAINLLALAVWFFTSGCGETISRSPTWEEPAEPERFEPGRPDGWSPREEDAIYLGMYGRAGRLLVTEEQFLVPTGFGIRCIRRASSDPSAAPSQESGGEEQATFALPPASRSWGTLRDNVSARDGTIVDIPTPGWSSAVVKVGEKALWVADGISGIARLQATGGEFRYVASHRFGTVRDLAPAGEFFLAAIEEGLLLVLRASAGGVPSEKFRLVLDGRPAYLSVRSDGGAIEWLAGTNEGGLYEGALASDGRPTIRSHDRSHWARAVAFTAGSPIAAGGESWIWGPGLKKETATGSQIEGMTAGASVSTWLAADSAGLLLYRGGEVAEVRRRDAHAVSVAAAGELGRVFVGWSDGRIEEIDEEGNIISAYRAGEAGRAARVSGSFVALETGRDKTRLLTNTQSFDELSRILELDASGSGALMALESIGAVEFLEGPHGYRRRLLREGHAGGIRRDLDGSLLVADEEDGLLRLSKEGELLEQHRLFTKSEATCVALSKEWIATAAYFGGDLLAIPRDGGTPVRALLPGRPASIVLKDRFAVVGVTLFGIAVVPLSRGDWPDPLLFRLPIPPREQNSGRLCETDDGVLVMLGEGGIAEVAISQDGKATLKRVIETPGIATDATPGPEPSTWLVADQTDILLLRLAPRMPNTPPIGPAGD